jgi:hypothetical protein
MPLKVSPSISLATFPPRLQRIRKTVTKEVAATQSQAFSLASRQPVSSICTTGCALTYSRASATGSRMAARVRCSNAQTAPTLMSAWKKSSMISSMSRLLK